MPDRSGYQLYALLERNQFPTIVIRPTAQFSRKQEGLGELDSFESRINSQMDLNYHTDWQI